MRLIQAAFSIVVGGFLIVVGGLVVAVIMLFVGPDRHPTHFCPIGKGELGYDWVCEGGSYDPWTGVYTPFTFTYTSNVSRERVTWSREPDRGGIMPLPVYFVAGSLLTLAVITIAAIRRGGNPRKPRRSKAQAAIE